MTDIGPYPVGQNLTSTITFADENGDPADPTAVTFKVKEPDGTITTYTYGVSGITKTGTGVYEASVTFDTSGAWWRRWGGTGTLIAAFEAPWTVTDSVFD